MLCQVVVETVVATAEAAQREACPRAPAATAAHLEAHPAVLRVVTAASQVVPKVATEEESQPVAHLAVPRAAMAMVASQVEDPTAVTAAPSQVAAPKAATVAQSQAKAPRAATVVLNQAAGPKAAMEATKGNLEKAKTARAARTPRIAPHRPLQPR